MHMTKTPTPSTQFPLELFVGDHAPSFLKKPIEAIQVAIVGGYHSRTQRLAFNLFLQHAHKAGMEIDQYEMPKRELVQLMEYNSRNMGHLKKTLIAMQELRMELDVMATAEGREKAAERWASVIMVRSVGFDGDNVYFSFDKAVKPYLFDPDTYANLDLNIQKRLTLDTSFVLYEWMVRYRNVNRTRPMSWEQWRSVLYADKQHSATMEEYKEFKRRKLMPAIRELNELTDLNIELVEIKGGARMVRDLQFLIVDKPRFVGAPGEGARREELENRMKVFGLSRTERRNIFDRHEIDLIESTVSYVAQRLSGTDGAKPIKDPARYFKNAVARGYTKGMTQFPATAAYEATPDTSSDNAAKELERQYHEQRTTQAWKMFAEMSETEQLIHIAKHNSQCEPTMQVPQDPADRSNRIMVPFCSWLAKDTWGEPTLTEVLAYAIKATGKGG